MSGDDESGAPPDDVVPSAFVAARPRRRLDPHSSTIDPPLELKPFRFENFKGQLVEVRSSGFSYRGTMVGADEDELYLRSETRWIVLPLSRVTSVKIVDEKRRPLGGPRSDGDG